MERVEHSASVIKVDEGLGLVFGWAVISTVKGEPYFDLQQDYIPEDEMLKASTEFMIESRKADEMHDEEEKGIMVHSFPLTSDIAKAYGIQTEQTGWLIAMKPNADMLQKFKDGTYKGFSIGGHSTMRDEVA